MIFLMDSWAVSTLQLLLYWQVDQFLLYKYTDLYLLAHGGGVCLVDKKLPRGGGSTRSGLP